MSVPDPAALFKSTASYYARYRQPYPPALIDLIVARFSLDGTTRLLDLGCGTGLLALPLAARVAEVVGLDPQPEMLAEAAAQARARGIANVRWVEGGAADLDRMRADLGVFRLAAMANAFHWMDQDATLRALDSLIEPGGGVAILGGNSLWSRANEWQKAVRVVVQRWLGERRRAGAGTYRDPGERFADVLARSPFRRVESHAMTYQLAWDLDGVVGHLYSTSFCSPAVLGDKREGFERDLRATLAPLAPDGMFHERVALDVLLAWRD